ncbi:hypothetical protein QT970_06750 [Microcoleus sp. herbarium8]|uniref:hypothetical protein n=1 Tax=Microcoleus sp. herbarium8 TaxID=3055436 RepID=UPI002FD61230
MVIGNWLLIVLPIERYAVREHPSRSHSSSVLRYDPKLQPHSVTSTPMLKANAPIANENKKSDWRLICDRRESIPISFEPCLIILNLMG